MRIKNQSTRLIVLNYMENGKTRKSLPLGAGHEVENEHITDEDIAFYKKNKSIVKLDDTAGADTGANSENKNKGPEPVVLPEELTLESLKKALTVDEMKQYCKDNKIKGITGKDETELATMILESLGIEIKSDDTGANSENDETNQDAANKEGEV
jgi:hypothetical protein